VSLRVGTSPVELGKRLSSKGKEEVRRLSIQKAVKKKTLSHQERGGTWARPSQAHRGGRALIRRGLQTIKRPQTPSVKGKKKKPPKTIGPAEPKGDFTISSEKKKKGRGKKREQSYYTHSAPCQPPEKKRAKHVGSQVPSHTRHLRHRQKKGGGGFKKLLVRDWSPNLPSRGKKAKFLCKP